MLKEFKEFALKGNVLDLAVAFILGASFGKIVTSLVNDVIMPPIGLLLGKIDFSSMFLDLTGKNLTSLKAAKDAGAAVIAYGQFINIVIEFLIVAFVLFLIVKWMNKMKRKEEKPAPAAPAAKECPFCFSQIPIKATRCPNCTSELVATAV